ncbi:hypothetical protein BOX15_Mlig028394g1 [Macrostomum lignano]|uniref:Uncharacterized protein n=1 Tax=Macrostomum lignano TaxID=282301 RepID=A0A267GBH6_9PLAT|nr:hypothetical protein BOX15_Mlig028394g1 [Macrostomum lignano]
MTITLEYDRSEDKEQKLVAECDEVRCLRYIHLMPPVTLTICGCILGGLSSLALLLRDIDNDSLVMLKPGTYGREGKSSRTLGVWCYVGLGAAAAGVAHLLLCLTVLKFRRPEPRLGSFLQALAAQQRLGESRDPSLFNSNQHFRRFPPNLSTGGDGGPNRKSSGGTTVH